VDFWKCLSKPLEFQTFTQSARCRTAERVCWWGGFQRRSAEKESRTMITATLALSFVLTAAAPAPDGSEPTRIVIECEDMQGVCQDRFGPGDRWQVGRWGIDLLQNMTFGGPWASRLRTAMTDPGASGAEIAAEFEIPADGTYQVWVKYECPPGFNYAFGVRIEPLGSDGRTVFERIYGLRQSAKHFCFNKGLTSGDQYWSWGIDHDAAEAGEATLAKGRYRLTISKTNNPEPKGPRSIDAILITSDRSEISSPRMPRYPLLDELRRANHVYFRFRNPKNTTKPIRVQWNHWNHRYPDFYTPNYRELVRFYDADGKELAGGTSGDWPEPIAPGGASPWYDLGPTMNTESTSPFEIQAFAEGAPPPKHGEAANSLPVGVDIALGPSQQQIVKSFETAPGEPSLAILVQPDLHRREGVEYTRKIADIYRDITQRLNAEPRLGPLPRKLRLFGATGGVRRSATADDLKIVLEFREALGLNTLGGMDAKAVPAVLQWARGHGGIVERSLNYHHTQDPDQLIKSVREGGVEKQFYYVSFGDEIGLPAIDVKDAEKVEAFRAFVRSQGETPESLGVAGWDAVKPLSALSSDVAVQIGVLPEKRQADAGGLAGLKRLYWYSLRFRDAQGIASFAQKTQQIKAALGPEVETTANLGSMQPFYWMHQASFIEAFKHGAMSLAWSEDYTYCQPEASRLVADFEAAYLRKGASYHDQPMMFYCMAHWPGNNPEQLIQNAVLQWGQNVKDLNLYEVGPDAWSTENYVAYRGGLPTWRAIRTISGMAGRIEDHLLPARTRPARIALLLSEASDVWELEGQGQGAVEPGSTISNISQEERKNLWYALRYAGYRVDPITENDCADGLLNGYSVLYVCGQNLQRKAARAIADWVKAGGTVFATAGAARKDEFDAPLAELDEVLGRGRVVVYERYRGPLRARLELPFVNALDEVKLADAKTLPVYCSREEFAAEPTSQVLATYRDGKPALIVHDFGRGRAYCAGFLPGQAWAKAAMPVVPQGKGGPHTEPWMAEHLGHDPVAAATILAPMRTAGIEPDVVVDHYGVITNRLQSDASTVITVVNLALEVDGELKDITLRVAESGPVKRVWSCFHPEGNLLSGEENGAITVKLPTLGPADVVVVERGK
jgi:hypothetical protein